MQSTTVLPGPRLREVVRARRSFVGPLSFALLAAAAAAALLYAGRGTTFYQDEWAFVLDRRDWSIDSLLQPHNEHLVLVPALAFKLLFATVGLDPYWPFRLTLVAAHLVCVGLFFVLARQRAGDLVALALCAPLLVLGYAWEDLLWPFQIGFVASVAAGLAALLALEHENRRGNTLACAALALSLASASVGLAFIVMAAAELVARRRATAAIWIAGLPLLGWMLWYAEFGRSRLEGGGSVGANAWFVPPYVLDSAALTLSALLGIGTEWGRPLLLAGLLLGAHRLARISASPRLVALAAGALAFWTLTALARAHLGPPLAGRYVYPGAILLLLIGVELARGARARRAVTVAVVVLAGIAAFDNLERLRRAGNGLRENAAYVKAELGALELVRGANLPEAVPDATGRGRPAAVDRYLEAVNQLGSPADTPGAILARSEAVRGAVDTLLVQALSVRVDPVARLDPAGRSPLVEAAQGGSASRSGRCVVFEPSPAGGSFELTVREDGIAVRGTGSAPVGASVRRFADTYAAERSFSLSPTGATLYLPSPEIRPPWRVRVGPVDARVRLCGAALLAAAPAR